MSEQKIEWPEPGDLVMATIKTVMDYGVYANLDEYNKRGFLHISEISSARIRNIRDFVRENQKLVLKVLRVDHEKGHIDLSLRRVTKRERIEKVKSWKKDRKGDALLYVVAERTGLPREEAYQKVGAVLDENYGLYDGFEKVLKDGVSVLTQLDVPEELAKVVLQVAEERIRVKTVEAWGILEVRCSRPNGVRCIQEAFSNAKKTHKTKDTKFDFSVIAAPKYRIEVSAENWKRAEEVLNKVSEAVIANISDAGGSGAFKREK
ncbi:MAG: translation initiation factor IF-2 subunit alpha [Nitrososphaerota archaeon]|jgi:translation initiation factor 2 subunit 1|nr:translation initiation factor IF-2 subunit alpha [Nitrososphaerota archaeon]